MWNRHDKTVLTQKEQEAWDLFQQGLTYQEIAEKLHIAKSTVDWRIRSARVRLKAKEQQA